jgi:hypothetical protein
MKDLHRIYKRNKPNTFFLKKGWVTCLGYGCRGKKKFYSHDKTNNRICMLCRRYLHEIVDSEELEDRRRTKNNYRRNQLI